MFRVQTDTGDSMKKSSEKVKVPDIHPGLWCYNCGSLGHHVTIQCPRKKGKR